MFLPSSQPKLVNPGSYEAEIVGDAVEKTSAFDSAKVYFLLPLLLHSRGAEPVKFTWAFPPDSPLYQQALKAIGGREGAIGAVDPPEDPSGRRFRVTIGRALRKDGKEKAEITSVEALPDDGQGFDDDDPLDDAVRSGGKDRF